MNKTATFLTLKKTRNITIMATRLILTIWQRGYNAFESGKWIVAFGQCNSWQRKAYKAGYETARLYSYATHDNPTDYQLDKLKSIIKG